MRNLLAFLAALIIGFAGVGWYLGWYKVETAWLSSGHQDIHIDIDGKKIGQDARKLESRGEEFLQKHNAAGTDASVETNIKNTPGKTIGNPQ